MNQMTKRERVEAVFNHQEPDRVAVYDIIHNIPIMEHFAGEKITNANAFDVSLRGVGRALDLTRCIAIPFTGERVHSASQGFEYSFDWWTFTVTKRPYKNVEHLAECVRREIDGIYDAMAAQPADRRRGAGGPAHRVRRAVARGSPRHLRQDLPGPGRLRAHPPGEHRRPDHSLCARGRGSSSST